MKRFSWRVVWCSLVGLLLGVLIAPLAIYGAAVGGDGFSIGNPLGIVMLFPYSALMSRIPINAVDFPLLIIGAVQYPIYGLVLGDAAAAGTRRLLHTGAWLFGAHLVASGVCAAVIGM